MSAERAPVGSKDAPLGLNFLVLLALRILQAGILWTLAEFRDPVTCVALIAMGMILLAIEPWVTELGRGACRSAGYTRIPSVAATQMSFLAISWGPPMTFVLTEITVFRSIEDPRLLVWASLAGAPLAVACALVSIYLSARLGAGPLHAYLGSTPMGAFRAAWRLSAKLKWGGWGVRWTALAFEAGAAVAAMAFLGVWSAREVTEASWSGLIQSELAATGLWRIFGAPIPLWEAKVWRRGTS